MVTLYPFRETVAREDADLDEAVLGAKVDVPTISGSVSMTIPPGTSSGQRLRLKRRGIKRGEAAGDQLVRIKIVLPKAIDEDMRTLAERWRDSTDSTSAAAAEASR